MFSHAMEISDNFKKTVAKFHNRPLTQKHCNRLESVILLKVCKISAVQIIEEIFINYQRTLISKQKDESDSRKEMRERT